MISTETRLRGGYHNQIFKFEVNETELEKQLLEMSKTMNRLFSEKVMTKANLRKVARRGAQILARELTRRAPKFDDQKSGWAIYGGHQGWAAKYDSSRYRIKNLHFRYTKEAPSGAQGMQRKQPTAIYKKGNLSRSHRTFSYRRSKSVWVGPRIPNAGKGKNGMHNGKRNADGFYAQWLDEGTKAHEVHVFNVLTQRYMSYMVKGVTPTHYRRKALRSVEGQIRRAMLKDFEDHLPKFVKMANKRHRKRKPKVA